MSAYYQSAKAIFPLSQVIITGLLVEIPLCIRSSLMCCNHMEHPLIVLVSQRIHYWTQRTVQQFRDFSNWLSTSSNEFFILLFPHASLLSCQFALFIVLVGGAFFVICWRSFCTHAKIDLDALLRADNVYVHHNEIAG